MRSCDKNCDKMMSCDKCGKQLCEIRMSGEKEYCMNNGFYLIDEEKICVDCHRGKPGSVPAPWSWSLF